jgi:hypothetical protein
MTEPSYSEPKREAMDERSDSAAAEARESRPEPAEGSPPQGEHHAAGGRPGHRRPDGGLGLGHRAPPGWPKGHQR